MVSFSISLSLFLLPSLSPSLSLSLPLSFPLSVSFTLVDAHFFSHVELYLAFALSVIKFLCMHNGSSQWNSLSAVASHRSRFDSWPWPSACKTLSDLLAGDVMHNSDSRTDSGNTTLNGVNNELLGRPSPRGDAFLWPTIWVKARHFKKQSGLLSIARNT